MLVQETIAESNTNMGAPSIFLLRPNRKLGLCVKYWHLNAVTMKDRYPLPLIDKLRDQVVGYEWFTKLDLRDGYYLVQLKDEGSENATMIRTYYGNFKYKVIHFGFVNTPVMFQHMINTILNPLLDPGVVVDVYNILIYTKTMEGYRLLITKVFSILQKERLGIVTDKSFFYVKEVEILQYIINVNRVEMSTPKIKAL
jgi:hypothetical protein